VLAVGELHQACEPWIRPQLLCKIGAAARHLIQLLLLNGLGFLEQPCGSVARDRHGGRIKE
jgi:hypothetical protein